MTHDVFFPELDIADAFNFAAHFQRLDQPALFPLRQVNLRHVPGDHRFRIEAQPRQKHFHLFAGSVLRLVQNHERIVERAPAHERERRHLDNAFFEEPLQFVCVQHVVQRVIERAHVRIDFLLQRSRQESQPLARFHRRPRQNDAVHLLGQQRAHCHGHREIRLPRAPGAGGKHHVVLLNRLHIMPLICAFRRNLFLPK